MPARNSQAWKRATLLTALDDGGRYGSRTTSLARPRRQTRVVDPEPAYTPNVQNYTYPRPRPPSVASHASFGSISSRRPLTTQEKAFNIVRHVFPIVDQFVTGYDMKLFLADFSAAITVAFVLVPQAIAYSGLARIEPIRALVSAVWPVIIYAIFGGSKQLSAGPEALTSVLVGAAVMAEEKLREQVDPAAIAAILTFMVGILCLFLSVVKAGFMDNILSGYMLTGFVAGVANLIMVEQLPGILGVSHKKEEEGSVSTLMKLEESLSAIGHDSHVPTIAVSIANILFLIIIQRLKKTASHHRAHHKLVEACKKEKEHLDELNEMDKGRSGSSAAPKIARIGHEDDLHEKGGSIVEKFLDQVPEVLCLVIVMIIISFAADFKGKGIKVLGRFDNKLPPPTLPMLMDFELVKRLMSSALLIALCGFIESQSVTKNFGLKNNYFPSGDQELMAFGFTNVIGSILGCYVVFGSLPRSRILANAGGQTMMCGLMAGIIVLLCIIFLEPVLQFLPKPTLSSIVFVAAYNLIEWGEIFFIARLRAWSEFAMMIGTWIITLVLSIEIGIVLSVLFAALAIVKRTAKVDMTLLGRLVLGGCPPGMGNGYDKDVKIPPAHLTKFVDIKEHPEAELPDGILILGVQAPILFYNAGLFRKTMNSLTKASKKLLEAQRETTMHSTHHLMNSKGYSEKSQIVVNIQGDEKQMTGGSDIDMDKFAVLIDLRNCNRIDSAAAHTLRAIIRNFKVAGHSIVFSGLHEQPLAAFKTAGLYELLGSENIFDTIYDGISSSKTLSASPSLCRFQQERAGDFEQALEQAIGGRSN
ncbi:Solute carrier 26 [Quaeritorhiza haematococci]|nr:Solute carrier 26 [Quaeritorhiza haematococci]